jgi:phosphopantetheinyl transferase (holo-ACP synthase)
VTERVGIDLEYMRVNINAFASKFLNKREKITKRWADRTYHLYIHWCAKEAIYKICDKEGINIVNDITIEPFDVKESGEIKGSVSNERIDDRFTLYYSRMTTTQLSGQRRSMIVDIPWRKRKLVAQLIDPDRAGEEACQWRHGCCRSRCGYLPGRRQPYKCAG